MTKLSVTINAVLTGRIAPLGAKGRSAIAKTASDTALSVSFAGLDGDFQADKRHHGGPDKALHHYPLDHYARWRAAAPDHPKLNAPGAFGENLSTIGLDETAVFIGDRFRAGTALIEISQGRQPCNTQARFLEWTALPSMIVRERRCGWYYRVIEEGVVGRGDSLTLVDRPLPEWSVARVFGLLFSGDHKTDPAALAELNAMPLLFEGWRARAEKLRQR